MIRKSPESYILDLLNEVKALESERDLAIEQRNMGAEIIEGNCKKIDALQGTRDYYFEMLKTAEAERDRLRDLLAFNGINPDAIVESAKGADARRALGDEK